VDHKKRIKTANQIYVAIFKFSISVFNFRNGDIDISQLKEEFKRFLDTINDSIK